MHDTTFEAEDENAVETVALGAEDTSSEVLSGGAPNLERFERGTLVNRYVVIDVLGVGGMGVVYRAYDPELGREVALKLLRLDPNLADASNGEVRLLREARALAQLRHPNVLSVYDAGVVGQRVFVALELVDGTTLQEWLQTEPRGTTEIVQKFLQAAQGLQAVHGAGLVHRDFKPKNVQIGKDGRVYLLDFGLARLSEPEAGESPLPSSPGSFPASGASPANLSSRSDAELDSDLTAVGNLVGTPAYLPPEAWSGARPDPRRDQFSFCLSLFQALAGTHPFPNWRLRDASNRWWLAEPPRFLALPRSLRRTIVRGLACDPEERHPSMDALIGELNRALERPRRFAVVIALILAALGGGLGTRVLARPNTPTCAEAGSDIESVWGPAQKTRIGVSFDRVGSAFARDSFARASAMIDAWAGSWRAMRQEACVATRVAGRQSEDVLSRRYACLDRRLVELRAVADVLAEVDQSRVAQAVKAVQGLTPLSVCTNSAALASANEPEQPDLRASVTQARTLLARAGALISAGRPDEALPVLETARADGARLSFRPLEAEALLLHARAEMKLGRDTSARATLERAILAAEAGRDDATSAAATADLVINAARRADEIETQRAEGHARAWLERMGGDLRLESRIEGGLGVLHYMKGTFGQSAVHYQKAIDLLKRAGGELDPESPRTHTNLASSLTYLGRYAEAIGHVEAALRALDATVGPDHPDRAFAGVRLAETYLRLGRRAEARPHLEQALALHEGRDAFAAAPHALLGILFNEDGDAEQALRHAERAHGMYQRTDGKDGPLTLDTLSIVGTVLRQQGRLTEALAAHEQVLTGFESTPGNDEVIIGTAHAEIARDLAELKRSTDAKAAFEKALALHRKREGETRMDIAADLEGLGSLELEGKTPEAALSLYREALSLVEPGFGPDAPALVKYLTGLGRAELARGAAKEALVHLERAEKILAKERWPARTLGDLRFALAAAVQKSGGDAARSAALAVQAEQHFRAAKLPNRVADVAKWRRGRNDVR